MKIGFRATNKTATGTLGKLSGFNVWSFPLKADEILRMSHGCGDEAGDMKAWKTVKQGLEKAVEMQWYRTCNDRRGKSARKLKQDKFSNSFNAF